MKSVDHNTLGLITAVAGVILGPFGASSALAQDKEALIKNALSAAPPAVAEAATVVDNKGNLLREGSGEFTCFPYEGGLTAAMCADAEWMAWGEAYMAQATDYQPSHLGLAYMLAGDPPEGASNIDPFATAATPDNQWVTEGPHVMILVPDPALLEGISTDPVSGGVCDVEGHALCAYHDADRAAPEIAERSVLRGLCAGARAAKSPARHHSPLRLTSRGSGS